MTNYKSLSDLKIGESFQQTNGSSVYTLIEKECKVFDGFKYSKIQNNGTLLSGIDFQKHIKGQISFVPYNQLVKR